MLAALVLAALIPATNGFQHDSRAEITGGRLAYELVVSIVLLTAIPEEFAFAPLVRVVVEAVGSMAGQSGLVGAVWPMTH